MGTWASDIIRFTPREDVYNTDIARAVLSLARYQDPDATVAGIAEQLDDEDPEVELGSNEFTMYPSYQGGEWEIRLHGDVGYSFRSENLEPIFPELVKLCDTAVTDDWADSDFGGEHGRLFYGAKAAVSEARFQYYLAKAIDELRNVCSIEVDAAVTAVAKIMRSI